jgi:phage terminase small subunit
MTMNTELGELPTLTPKQTAFVHALLQSKTASAAYREAYDCKKMSTEAVWVEASRLRSNTKVSLWLRHFQRIGMDEARITIGNHLTELARARELALANGQISAGVQAEHYRGKAAGLYEDPLRLAGGPSDFELIKAIKDALGRELAEEIATALGEAPGPI